MLKIEKFHASTEETRIFHSKLVNFKAEKFNFMIQAFIT